MAYGNHIPKAQSSNQLISTSIPNTQTRTSFWSIEALLTVSNWHTTSGKLILTQSILSIGPSLWNQLLVKSLLWGQSTKSSLTKKFSRNNALRIALSWSLYTRIFQGKKAAGVKGKALRSWLATIRLSFHKKQGYKWLWRPERRKIWSLISSTP